jgi:AcrR family transcriptional regulator
MSQPSDIAKGAKAPRRVPRQERAERTVAAVLDAAAAEIAHVGYEAATMTAIAERAGASIGAVYQYFPNKAALVEALRAQYGAIMHGMWRPLIADAGALAIPELVDRIFGVFIDFIDGHPAYFPLLNAPVSRRRDQTARNRLRLREEFAAAFGRKQPALPPEEALRVARVAVEMVKAINPLYGDVKPKERLAVIAELKLALVAYLRERLAPPGSP